MVWRTCGCWWSALPVILLLLIFLRMHFSFSGQQIGVARTVTWLSEERLTTLNPNDSRLLDIDHFRYTLQPEDVCANLSSNGLFFLIYVHSAPDNFQEREVIRATWGSVRVISDWDIRLIFLLGLSEHLQDALTAENEHYGDLLQGNFVDNYRNLSYKHLMGYKWVLSNCRQVRFIVKADDDAFVDVLQLFHLMGEMYRGQSLPATLACSVWPEGSVPQRSLGHKWAVSREEYPFDTYPAYCSGLAYVITPSAAKQLLAASLYVPFFWIDDLYVTGLLLESVPWLRQHALNLRTTYEWQKLLRWLREPLHRFSSPRPSPYIFAHVHGSRNQSHFIHKLWSKSKMVWKNADVFYHNAR